ncbi:DUF3892 domain-containing protein [Phenylobacterium sp.]|uniref:DUF3892 domain-containing protein n=1 Tax=Phenylobacterium sp. TaxID=1871053 RepID=UPI0030036D4B
MADARVTCITRQPRKSPHEGITHLGGHGWKRTKVEVIAAIEGGRDTFHIQTGVTRAEIGVLNGPNGKYLRAYEHGQWNDSLLTLPTCI